MADVKIRVLFDSTEASAAARRFTEQAVGGNKAAGDSAKQAAAATLEQARVTKTLADASLQTARAQELDARATLANERAKRSLTQAMTVESSARKMNSAAIDQEAKAQERLAAASARSLGQQRRAAIAGENAQARNEATYIRDQRQVGEGRRELGGQAADGAMVTGGILLGGLAAAGAEAAKFDTMMVRMRNNTLMTDEEFQAFRTHILSLGVATGASLDQLGAAVMRAKNHGLTLKESIAVVDAATHSALATGADIGETANVLAQTLHIFHLNASQTTEAMNVLHTAANTGNMTMQDLVNNFGLAEAVTSKYGLSLTDTAAIMATMTQNGLDAAQSGVQIRDVMQHLINPTKAARQEFDRLSHTTGVDLTGDLEKLKTGQITLTQVMIDLNAATHGQAAEIIKLIPAQRGSFGAMALTGKAAEDLKTNFDNLNQTMSGKLDPTTAGFARQQKTLQAQTDKLNDSLIVLGIKVGGDVVPALESGTKKLIGLIDAFNRLTPEEQHNVEQTVAWVGGLTLAGGAVAKTTLFVLSLTERLRLLGIGAAAAGGEAGVGGLLTRLGGLKTLLLTRLGPGTIGALFETAAGTAGLAAAGPLALGAVLNKGIGGESSLDQEKKLFALAGPGAVVKGRAAGPPGVGDRIAAQALDLHLKGSADKYRHYCQELVRTTVQSVSHAYDPYFKGSARETMGAFKAAGIGHPYQSGESLAPGSLLYSGRWGGKSGHAMLADANGFVVDNVGTGWVSANRRPIDYVVPPPPASGPAGPAAATHVNRRATFPAQPLTPEQISLHEQAIAAVQGQYAGERATAKDTYEKDKAVNPADAWKVYQGELKRIHGEELAEQKKHTDALNAEAKRQQAARAKLVGLWGTMVGTAAKAVGGVLSGDPETAATAGRSAKGDAAAYWKQQQAAAAQAKTDAKAAQDARDAARKTLSDTQDRAFETGALAFTEYIQILNKRLQAAQGDGEALIDIGRQIDQAFEQESSRQEQVRAAQGAATLKNKPLRPGAEVDLSADLALDAGDGPNLSRPGKRGATTTVGGLAFWGGLQDQAAQMSGKLVGELLSGQGSKISIKSFWHDVSGIGISAVSQAMTTVTSNALSGLIGGGGKGAFSGLSGLFKGAKGDMLAGAAGIYGAAMALGAGGKKKQKHSILGGLIGFAAGSLLPGVGNLEGAEFGSALGGMFADGGSPPVGKWSLVGERGPELLYMGGPGQVVPLDRPFSPKAPTGHGSFGLAGPAGSPAFAPGPKSPTMNVTQNIHNPTYASDVDTERDHERLGRALEKSFLLG